LGKNWAGGGRSELTLKEKEKARRARRTQNRGRTLFVTRSAQGCLVGVSTLSGNYKELHRIPPSHRPDGWHRRVVRAAPSGRSACGSFRGLSASPPDRPLFIPEEQAGGATVRDEKRNLKNENRIRRGGRKLKNEHAARSQTCGKNAKFPFGESTERGDLQASILVNISLLSGPR
jgi:hypothetical protein